MFRALVFASVVLLGIQWLAVAPCAHDASLTAAAQSTITSAAARKQAGSWFNNGQDLFLQRAGALTASDVDVWVAAAKRARLTVDRADLGFTMPKFNPLFDAKQGLVPGAPAKYAKRLGQLPAQAVAEWQQLTGGEPLVVAMSLAAESTLFPREVFSETAFRTFVARFK